VSSLLSSQPTVNLRSASDIALLHQLECRACPLTSTKNGKLKPTGTEHPLVYILGDAAATPDIAEQEQFSGEAGQLLHAHIPRRFKDKVRFNNTVRCRPPQDATPERTELECCRPSVASDIERSRPKAIFGFGSTPLDWVSSFNGITLWRGRRMPVKVGAHTCWYYPFQHPEYLLKQRRGDNAVGSEEERMFAFDLKRAFSEVETLPEAVVHTAADVRRGVETITQGGAMGVLAVKQALKWAAQQPVIGVDYETSCLRAMSAGAKILTIAVATATRAIAFPLDHPEAPWTPFEREEVVAAWKHFLKTAKGVKAVHNLAFELEWSGVVFGLEYVRAGIWEDTQAQACILDERKGNKKAGPFSLEFLIQQYFGFNLKKMSGVDRANLAETPIEAVLQYNAPDARYHALLWEKQAERIKEEGLEEAYGLALRRVPTCVLTQIRGLPVDQVEVKRLQDKYSAQLKKILAQISALPIIADFKRRKNTDFKPLSNPDVIYVFKDMLNRSEILVEDKYTKKKRYSADESVLEQINHPLSKLLIELRGVNRLKSTYVDPLAVGAPTLYPDGQLHAVFNTVFSEAGRLSVDGPSLQNFPKRDSDAKEVRKPVVAEKECVILAFDEGQIEARVICMFTKDKRFSKALWERYDVHAEWAERLARAYPTRVGGKKNLTDKKTMKDFRTDVKNQWVFPLFFGARLSSAAGYLQIPEHVIKPLYEEFWKQFSGVKEWQERQLEFYRQYGYTECLTGRRRHGPLSTNQIFNAPIQGTAAEIVLSVMCDLSETGDPELQCEINIHDDLTFVRVPEKRVDIVAEKILDIMLFPKFDWINVPITVEGAIGTNWAEMSEFGVFSSDQWKK